MSAAYDPDELNRSEQSAGGSAEPKWSGDDANYDTKWGGDYGSDNVNQAEKAAANPAGEDQFKYTPGAGDHHASLRSRLFRGRRRKAAIGTAIVALIVAAIASVIIGILPLKILHIVNNLQARFYATAENAVEKETEKLFSRYVLGKMLAGCRGVYIDQNCNPYEGKTLVTRLYRGWSDGRLEEKLRQQAGIEIRKNQSGRFEMRFSGGDRLDIEGLRENKTLSQLIDAKGDWTEVRKNQVRGVYKTALKGATRHASAMYYLKVTPYLGKKFGIKWCVIGCNKKDDFRDWKIRNVNDKKFGAKMWLSERVLGPRFELYSMIMRCLYVSDAFCSRDNVIDSVRNSENARPYSATVEGCNQGCSDNGRHVSTSLNEMEAKLVALAASFGSDHDSLRKIFDRFEKSGFIGAVTRSLIDEKVDDVGDREGRSKLKDNEEAIRRAEDEARKQGFGAKSAVRTLGWVVTAAYLVEFANEAPDVVTRLQYMANSTAMTQMWGMYRSVTDEGKEGETDAELYGSFWSSFNPGMQPTEGGGGQIGGTAGAEQTPLYNFVINQKKPSAAATARPANAPPLCSETGNTRYFLDESESTTENYYWGADPPVPSDGGDITVTRPDGTYSVTFYERQGSRGQPKGSTDGFPAQPDYCDPGDGSAFEPASSSTYRCKDNRPPSNSRIVCREMVLNDKQGAIQKLNALKRLPGWKLLVAAAGPITDVVDGAINTILSLINRIPFVGELVGRVASAITSLVTEVAKFTGLDEILKRFASWMLGDSLNLVSNNMSGGRTFDLMAGGADVSGNDFAHHGIGGVALTPEQLAANLDYYHDKKLAEFRQKSFLAQVTDTESTYSPISKMALALPANRTAAVNSLSDSFASLVKNPLGQLFNSFASIFTPKSLAASYPTGKSPFGITQYGYPLDDPIFNEDPDEYWQKYCVGDNSLTHQWNQHAADNLNPNTFEPENAQTTKFQSSVPGNKYGTNGCLLIQTAVASAGGTFTDDVLSPEELEGSATSQESEVAGSEIVGDIGENSDRIACAAGTKDIGVVNTNYTGSYKTSPGRLKIRLCQIPSIPGFGDNTSGATISGGAVVNSRVSGAWLALGQAAKSAGINLSSSSSFRLEDSCGGAGDGSRCARPGGSLHQMGVAIDFADINGFNPDAQTCSVRVKDKGNPRWEWLYKNAEKFGFKQYSAEAWHWDPLDATNRCGFG